MPADKIQMRLQHRSTVGKPDQDRSGTAPAGGPRRRQSAEADLLRIERQLKKALLEAAQQ